MRGGSAVDARSSSRRSTRWLSAIGLLFAALPAAALTWAVGTDETPHLSTAASAARVYEPDGAAPPEIAGPTAAVSATAATPAGAAGPRLEGRARAARPTRARPVRSAEAGLALLRRSRGWTAFLEVSGSMAGTGTAALRRERTDRVLTGLEDPVVRQNAIFLVALTWPWEEARPWLEDLRARGDPGDAEDALVALAFSGEPAALEAFRLLARARSSAPVHR